MGFLVELIITHFQPHPYAEAVGDNFTTASRISLPGLNFTTERRGIGTSVSGRLGLRPIRAFRTLTLKTPKFRNSTVVPAATVSEM